MPDLSLVAMIPISIVAILTFAYLEERYEKTEID